MPPKSADDARTVAPTDRIATRDSPLPGIPATTGSWTWGLIESMAQKCRQPAACAPTG